MAATRCHLVWFLTLCACVHACEGLQGSLASATLPAPRPLMRPWQQTSSTSTWQPSKHPLSLVMEMRPPRQAASRARPARRPQPRQDTRRGRAARAARAGALTNLHIAVCGGTPETNKLYWRWFCRWGRARVLPRAPHRVFCSEQWLAYVHEWRRAHPNADAEDRECMTDTGAGAGAACAAASRDTEAVHTPEPF